MGASPLEMVGLRALTDSRETWTGSVVTLLTPLRLECPYITLELRWVVPFARRVQVSYP